MGGGHNGVAGELAQRLRNDRHDVDVVDLLTVFPWRLGEGMRAGYRGMLQVAPWLYEAIYRGFFVPHEGAGPDASPAVHLAANGLRSVIAADPPDVVVSTFHLAGQAANQLRREGSLRAPSVVLVTEAEAHAMWRDPTTDLYLCVYPGQADQLRRELGVDARRVQPVVRPEFRRGALRSRPWSIAGRDRSRVLVSTGSWGVGHPGRVAHILASTGRYRPAVLCGHNDHLRRRLTRDLRDCDVLGWVTDMASLMAQSSVLVENAGGGLTCWEAFADGLPVVTFDPIAGHGRVGAARLQQAGMSVLASAPSELVSVLDQLNSAAAGTRQRLCAAEAAMFDNGSPHAAEIVAELAMSHAHSAPG